MNYSDFKAKAIAAHGGKYCYPKWEGNKLTREKVEIVCPEHGVFGVTINDHVNKRKSGCRLCGFAKISAERADSYEEFLGKVKAVHGDKYGYVRPARLRHAGKIEIMCPDHGSFFQNINSHLSGSGCPVCAEPLRKKSRQKTFEYFLVKARAAHGDKFDYPQPADFCGMRSRLPIVCKKHGLFIQEALVHVRSPFSCPKCAGEHTVHLQQMSSELIESRLDKMHGGQPWAYTGRSASRLFFYCSRKWANGDEHGKFSMLPGNFTAGKGCSACAKVRSRAEDEVKNYVNGLGFSTFKGNNRTLPGLGRFDLDIVVPDKKVAIEYNGVIWHSERFGRNKTSHLDKTELANSLGYRLIHIFEDEWLERRSAVEMRLRAILGVGLDKVYARNTRVSEISWQAAKEFLDTYHLQGAGTPAKRCFGLKEKDVLVSVATFGAARFTDDDWELLRFASSVRVVGGASKLLTAFTKTLDADGSLVSFADRRWSDGELYSALGFSFDGFTQPNYFYVKGVKRYSRQRFQKHKLENVLDLFDPSLTEVQNCRNNGYYRIFDCGHGRWRLNINAPGKEAVS
jgi:hypothetical protein